MRDVVRTNGLSDGRYVEPYAGGAAVAWELLITGIVRRVSINDINRPVFSFWHSVLNNTDELCRLIRDKRLTVDEWDRQKRVFQDPNDADNLQLGFSFFYLNRTNRSGIINGGIIGGRDQSGDWKIDARFNRNELIRRVEKIANHKSRIELFNLDAIDFLNGNADKFDRRTLIYLDPPYFKKGRFLYYDAYKSGDHAAVSRCVNGLKGVSWIVSYDDVSPIHDLYASSQWMQYTLNYSARNAVRGREVMFFSRGLSVPSIRTPLAEIDCDLHVTPRDVSERNFAA